MLYTDGLVEDREHDIDVGLERLRRALAGSGPSPEETCRAVLDGRPPARSSDDVALLVARTRALGPAGSPSGRFPPTRRPSARCARR